jgi:hypothetical protein
VLGPGAVVSTVEDDDVGAGRVEVDAGNEVDGGADVGAVEDLPPPHALSATIMAETSKAVPRR